ncbi:hypothetical protein [uncultured Microbacterium sp.]|uniref:DUF7927 domain-containing protein n=1 Tax=uncultured Microbacterium sp. TaxID=191216 RepID=UPI0025FCE56C|nr:hypothetical protein [uncultured Microbacterium sp.]
MLASPTAAQAAPPTGPAWSCSTDGYLFQSSRGNTPTIQSVNIVTGEAQEAGTTEYAVNAVGYNTLDNYMYGISGTLGNSVVAIAADGTITDLGNPGIDRGWSIQTGDFDSTGHLWVTAGGANPNNTQPYYEIDLSDPSSSTYGKILKSGTTRKPAADSRVPSDMTYVNGYFYGLTAQAGTGGGAGHLYRMDTNGVWKDLGAVAATRNESTGIYGASYADSEGLLYFSNNSSGAIYRVNPKTFEGLKIADGPASAGNDGARCADAPIPTVTVTKTVETRAYAEDQFTVALADDEGATLASATTTGTDTTASTTNWPVVRGTTYRLTDTMAEGSATGIDGYTPTVVCTDETLQTEVPTGGSPGQWTFTVPGDNQYSCNITNVANERGFVVSKAADKTTLTQGDTLTYTVTVRNPGTVPYTASHPASFTDDLAKVLDDATYDGDATDGATVSGTTLSWSGPLAAGETKTITYSVTVNTPDEGDLLLDNVVSPDTSIGGSCDPDLTCATSTPVQRYKVDKSADKVRAAPGETVTYTITVSNTGKVAYTEQSPASFDDDLSKVTDDAVYNNDATDGATVTGDVLSWAGPLAVGETKTITYSVTVNAPDTGDKVLENAVVPTGDGPEPPPPPIIVKVLSYSVTKTGDKTEVNPGEVVTYTVTVTNTGEADYTAEQPASFTDDLSKVTDDATYNGDATNGATVEGNTLSWSGTLAKGETKTITYSFTVNKPATGDRTLENAVVPTGPGPTPPPPPFITKVGTYSVEKAVDKTQAKPGDRVTYTITVTNTGQVDYTDAKPASFTDDLSKVTDDATYNGDASNGAVVSGNTLSWKGALAIGETKTIVYSFTVNTPDTGDKVLHNVVVPTGPGGDCTGNCETTTNTTPPPAGPLASTGGALLAAAPAWPWIGLGAVGFAILVALGITRVRRARTDATDED